MMKAIYKTGILTIVLMFTASLAFTQDFPEWPVPDNEAAVENPVEPTKESVAAGKALFNTQCKACHGETGKGDGLIQSASLVSETFTAQTDGAIFYKLKTGRGQMPPFAAQPEEQLWNVINYIRLLSMNPEDMVMKNAVISILFDEDSEKKEVTAKVEEYTEEGTKAPLANVKVNFGVKRYFGVLPVTTTSTFTNANGEVSVWFPDDIIGDETGELVVVAALEDMEYNPVEASAEISWGLDNPNDYWTERRALWKNNDYVPIWLLFSFIGGALAVWGTIGYVALLVFKIKRIGDKLS
jgi:mono/diheme cytochrome c family protein